MVTGTNNNLAFYWSAAMCMLPIMPDEETVPAPESRASFALSINNAGQVVGGIADFDDDFTANQLFAWHPKDGLTILHRPPEADSNSSFALAIKTTVKSSVGAWNGPNPGVGAFPSFGTPKAESPM